MIQPKDRGIEELHQLLADQPEEVRTCGVLALEAIVYRHDIAPALRILKQQTPGLQCFILRALELLGPQQFENVLLDMLSQRHWRLRTIAAHEIRKLQVVAAVELLIESLYDRISEVRLAAAEALAIFQDPRTIEPFKQLLIDRHKYVRSTAIEALAKLQGQQAIPLLIPMLRDGDRFVRLRAIETLAELHAFEALEDIITALRDRQAPVRRVAAEALGKLGDQRAVEPLIAALKDRQATVCDAIACALGDLGDQRAVLPLRRLLKRRSFVHGSHRNVYQATLYALGKLGHLEPAVTAIQDDDWLVRFNAAVALRKLQDKHTIPALVQALGDPYAFSDRYPVREVATKALEQLGYYDHAA